MLADLRNLASALPDLTGLLKRATGQFQGGSGIGAPLIQFTLLRFQVILAGEHGGWEHLR